MNDTEIKVFLALSPKDAAKVLQALTLLRFDATNTVDRTELGALIEYTRARMDDTATAQKSTAAWRLELAEVSKG